MSTFGLHLMDRIPFSGLLPISGSCIIGFTSSTISAQVWATPTAWKTIQQVTAYSRVCIFVFTSCTISVYVWAASPTAWNITQRVTAYSRVCIFVFTSCTIYVQVWTATTAWSITQPRGPMSLVSFPSYRAAQELCEKEGGPGLSFPIPFFPSSLINRTVSGEVKQNDRKRRRRRRRRDYFPVSDYTSEFAICIVCDISLKHKWTTDLGLAQA